MFYNAERRLKSRKKATIVIALFLLIIDAAITYFVFYRYAYYDSSPEFVLAKMLSEENRLLTNSWFYSSEIRVINTQIINSFLFKFISNWRILKTVSMFIHLVLLEAVYCYFIKQIDKLYRYSAIALLLPFSFSYVRYVLGGLYYIPHFFVTFLALGMFFHSQKVELKKHKIILFTCQIILAFFGGLGGIRHVQITYLPLMLTSGLLMVENFDATNEKMKMCMESIVVCGFSLVGYVFNSKLLSSIYSFSSYNDLSLTNFSFERIEVVINDILKNFGYTSGCELFSLRGLISILALLYIVLICTSFYKIRSQNKLQFFENYIFIFCFSTWIININVLLFTNNNCEPRYFLPQIVILVPCIAIVLNRITQRLYRYLFFIVTLIFIFTNSIVGYKFWIDIENNSSDMREVAEYLSDNNFTFGYAHFYTGNVLPELTNGNIDIYCVKDFSDMSSFDWLMKKDLLNKKESEEKVFVLMTIDEFNKNIDVEYLAEGEIALKNNEYVVIEYENNSKLWQEIE